MELPFKEEIVDNIFIREFKQDTDSGDYCWHRDREDRYVEPIGNTDWLFQLENELPIKIEGRLFVPKGAWHRAIKGTGDLKIRIKKI